MKWFKDKELTCRCCGQLPPLARENMEALVQNVLDPAREAYGKPIKVNSGYRCPKHNAEVGGAKQSQHMKGEAADITAGSPVENLKLAGVILAETDFDQMILENVPQNRMEPEWIHVSYKRSGKNRNQVLIKVKGRSGYFLPPEHITVERG